jgi:hypothetical protein
MKQILRAFRAFLKQQFRDMYGNRYYYWIPTTLRAKTKEFFDTNYPELMSNYSRFENVFVLLIHNTKSQDEIGRLTNMRDQGQVKVVAKLFKETFG